MAFLLDPNHYTLKEFAFGYEFQAMICLQISCCLSPSNDILAFATTTVTLWYFMNASFAVAVCIVCWTGIPDRLERLVFHMFRGWFRARAEKRRQLRVNGSGEQKKKKTNNNSD